MSKDTFKNKGDFLTLMLTDELFKGKDDYMVDECLTFMLAATMTTTLLISNSIYYLT
jgi:cytochrome P450